MQDIFKVRPDQVIGLQRNKACISGTYNQNQAELLPTTGPEFADYGNTAGDQPGQTGLACGIGPITGMRASSVRPRLIIIPKGFTESTLDIEQKIKMALGEDTQVIWLDDNQVSGLRVL